eukprot:6302528-Amphidinium_carterae.1
MVVGLSQKSTFFKFAAGSARKLSMSVVFIKVLKDCSADGQQVRDDELRAQVFPHWRKRDARNLVLSHSLLLCLSATLLFLGGAAALSWVCLDADAVVLPVRLCLCVWGTFAILEELLLHEEQQRSGASSLLMEVDALQDAQDVLKGKRLEDAAKTGGSAEKVSRSQQHAQRMECAMWTA